nr:MAG TPA: hypothetical protein [Caudoviricetes sp.]
MEKKQYIYLGNNIEFKNFSFSKGVVYFENDKIKEIMEKFPLIKKILIDIEVIGKIERNENIFTVITNQLREQIKEEDRNGL